ncbi:class I SAM-dependent methyltransferase [Bradyrhizobium sp.]|uniref:class I SAM-dependent methyltransferase n=1 Tax=Bradyrhizobium sp. TaxID=376 RepID=UPI0025BB3D35|nr:class I SAM-dependent methyltransferase [Bradyrhizobium sp.]
MSPIDRVRSIEWRNTEDFRLDGISYKNALGRRDLRTDEKAVVALKAPDFLEKYAQILEREKVDNIVELGVFQGGSALLFASIFRPLKLVGVDICDPVPALDKILSENPIGRSISIYYNTSQNDEAKLNEIFSREFGTEAIDLIVDDASHLYFETRASFEICFPRLRPGGYYVIEDWGWAHWPGEFQTTSRFVHQRRPMSQLIMRELRQAIESIRIFPAIVFIRKGWATPSGKLNVDDLYLTQGRKFEFSASSQDT